MGSVERDPGWEDRAAELLTRPDREPVPAPGVRLPEGLRPRDLDEAYAIQDRFAALIGPTTAYKISMTSPDTQRRFGIAEPVSAQFAGSALLPSPAEIAVAAFPGTVMAECEIGLRVGTAMAPSGAPYTEDAAWAAVASAAPCFEMPSSRYTGPEQLSGFERIADNISACFLAVGPDVASADLGVGDDLAVTVAVNGQRVGAIGGPWLATALVHFTWLANHLARRGITLDAGTIVSTGTVLGPYPMSAGDRIVAEIGSIGPVEVAFT